MRLTDHSARSAPTACWDGLRGTVRCSSVAAVEQALPKSRARAGGHGIVLILRACDWSKSLDFIGLWAASSLPNRCTQIGEEPSLVTRMAGPRSGDCFHDTSLPSDASPLDHK